MELNSTEKALELALEAHIGQRDKAGKAYISHPIRVMKNVDTKQEKITALLHDVIEDSYLEFEELEKYFSDEVVRAVACLTKKENESYEQFIERAKENPIARKVKIEDIRDNLDLERLDELEHEDLVRIQKYHKSLQKLKEGSG
jgi:(p)ppGpp synthase/HD superfamily hydrolase